MITRQKLILMAVFVAAAIGYLAYLGASSSWQYYVTVDEAASDSTQLIGKRIRVSGRVSAGSLTVVHDRRQATFELHGEKHTLKAICCCLLPDNLAENMDVVIEGTLQANGILGHKVITRCASKYRPVEMSTAQKKPGESRIFAL